MLKKICFKTLGTMTLIVLLGCRHESFEYHVSNSYTGLCIVFVVENYEHKSTIDNVEVKNGLAVINKNILKREYLFRSTESGNVYEIVKIGAERNMPDSGRYIFQLAAGTTSNVCSENIRSISFYVGSKSSFLNWNKKYHNEFDYFDSMGIDLCKYYKSHL